MAFRGGFNLREGIFLKFFLGSFLFFSLVAMGGKVDITQRILDQLAPEQLIPQNALASLKCTLETKKSAIKPGIGYPIENFEAEACCESYSCCKKSSRSAFPTDEAEICMINKLRQGWPKVQARRELLEKVEQEKTLQDTAALNKTSITSNLRAEHRKLQELVSSGSPADVEKIRQVQDRIKTLERELKQLKQLEK